METQLLVNSWETIDFGNNIFIDGTLSHILELNLNNIYNENYITQKHIKARPQTITSTIINLKLI